MSSTQRYATVVQALAAMLALLGLWTMVAPFVLSGAEHVLTHASIGVVVTAVAVWYLVRVRRAPETKIPSVWFVVVLGVLLLTGTLLTHTPGTAFFWSTILTSILLIALAVVSILWGSRFVAGKGEETTIFEL